MLFSRAAVTIPAVLFSCLVACSGTSNSPEGIATEDALQGGTKDTGDPAVGLVWFQGGGFCSGTLISPTVVLTAGHCVKDPIDGFYTGTGTATKTIGATPSRGFVKHAVLEAKAHPTFDPAFGSCPNAGVDIGLIHLAAPLAGVTPIGFNSGSAPALGSSCSAVGYGTHGQGSKTTFEQKRSGTETVAQTLSTAIGVKFGTAIADRGDSGGPLVFGSVVVGTTSCSAAPGDPAAVNYYARVDQAAAWIHQTLGTWH